MQSEALDTAEGFGVWTGYEVPQDRADWDPLVRRLYEYWLSIKPPDGLPGRRHVSPGEVAPLWSRMWMLDIHRAPLRFRYRFCGTDLVRSIGHEVTGRWLDVAHPEMIANPLSRDRFRFMAETGSATWRRGSVLWDRDPDHRTIESVVVPLATDGQIVDKMIAVSVLFDKQGRRI